MHGLNRIKGGEERRSSEPSAERLDLLWFLFFSRLHCAATSELSHTDMTAQPQERLINCGWAFPGIKPESAESMQITDESNDFISICSSPSCSIILLASYFKESLTQQQTHHLQLHLETLLLGPPLDEQVLVEQTSCLVPDSSIFPVHGLHPPSMPHVDDVWSRSLPNAGLSCNTHKHRRRQKLVIVTRAFSVKSNQATCELWRKQSAAHWRTMMQPL